MRSPRGSCALTAFANGSLTGFALRTLVRGPRPVLFAMTLLLVPWTVTLALLDTARWYAAPWMKWAWVSFDALLVIALTALLWRWRDWLGVLLAIAVTLDAALTIYQAITWYVPRAGSPALLILTAMVSAAPLIAAVVLWGTVRRQRAMKRGAA